MIVQDLIDELESMDPEAEVRFASQPNWPMEYSIDCVLESSECCLDDDDDEEKEIDDSTNAVYLAEKEQIGYLPSNVSRELGWR